jgi:NADPH oxidase
MFNYLYFNTAYDLRGLQGQPVMGLVSPDFNPVKNDAEDPVTVMWTTIAGVTGHVIIICLFLMITSSIDIMRRSYYEVFWYTHHLFVIFFAGFVIHGIQGLVKAHENVETIFDDLIKNSSAFNLSVFRPDQDPVLCFAAATGDLRDIVALDATQESLLAVEGLLDYCGPDRSDVEAGGAQSWKWVIVPLFVYLVERLLRIYRSSQTVVITKVISHPSKVLEIQMKKKGFHADVAQYVFICAPEIRYFEWHAFTLSSSPEEDYFSVHIRQVGDWTTELAKRCGEGRKDMDFQQAYNMPKILVDGPFGTASEDIFKHEVAVAVGGGIGVTPFASVLKSCWYRSQLADTPMKLEKVYFYWVCPDTNSFEWFQSLLQHLEEQMLERHREGFIEYHIYLTRGFDTKMARDIYMQEETEGDVITGLQQKTHYGRPNWDQIFPDLAEQHPNKEIGVFFCGPPVLSSKLHRKCNEYTSMGSSGTRFYYNKENF